MKEPICYAAVWCYGPELVAITKLTPAYYYGRTLGGHNMNGLASKLLACFTSEKAAQEGLARYKAKRDEFGPEIKRLVSEASKLEQQSSDEAKAAMGGESPSRYIPKRPGGEVTMDNVFDKIDGRPIHWCDGSGTVHRVEGVDVHPGVRLLWTKCKRDVPANAAYLLGDDDTPSITCVACAACLLED